MGYALLSHAGVSNARNETVWVLESVLGLSRLDIHVSPETPIDHSLWSRAEEAFRRRAAGEPLQYILGTQEFRGLDMSVRPGVLIPRPETEELVDWVIKDHQNSEPLSILDVGTGSGCIPITIKSQLKRHQVFGVDISKDALETAKHNAKRNNVEVNFIKADILSMNKLPIEADVIISNPPYVKYSEQAQMAKNVLDYEPHLALFVENEDPLVF